MTCNGLSATCIGVTHLAHAEPGGLTCTTELAEPQRCVVCARSNFWVCISQRWGARSGTARSMDPPDPGSRIAGGNRGGRFERAACARYETQNPAASDGGGSETAAHTPRRTSRSARPCAHTHAIKSSSRNVTAESMCTLAIPRSQPAWPRRAPARVRRTSHRACSRARRAARQLARQTYALVCLRGALAPA